MSDHIIPLFIFTHNNLPFNFDITTRFVKPHKIFVVDSLHGRKCREFCQIKKICRFLLQHQNCTKKVTKHDDMHSRDYYITAPLNQWSLKLGGKPLIYMNSYHLPQTFSIDNTCRLGKNKKLPFFSDNTSPSCSSSNPWLSFHFGFLQ